MKLIYDVLKKLRKQEIRQIRQAINASPFEYEKVGKLFELVTRYDEQEESFYSQKLYGKEPDNTFRVTKSRLKRMLENILLQDKSLSGYSADSINARLQTRKKLLQGEILLGRGAYDAGKNLLLQVISSAKRYDLYQERLQSELLLYRNLSIRTSASEFQKQSEDLLELNRLQYEINEALILQYHISNLLLNRTLKKEDLAAVRKQIDRIGELASSSDHPLARQAHFLTENYYAQVTGRYDDALRFCVAYLELLESEKALYSSQRVNAANVQLAKVTMQLGRIEEARAYTQTALDHYAPDEMNYLVCLELDFRLNFYEEKFADASRQIEQALAHPQFEASKMLAARWHYFHACLEFRKGNFREAYLKLNEATPLLTDKFGINLIIRFLEIILMFELGHLDIIENKVLNMRQYIKRTLKKKEMRRPQALIKILMTWAKKDFDFELVAPTIRELMEKHATEQKAVVDSSDQELIRIEEWMLEKAEQASN